MRGLSFAALVVCLPLAAAGQPTGADIAGQVAGVVAAGAMTLSVIPEGDLAGELSWAAWTEARPGGWLTAMALLRRRGGAVTPVWRTERIDAYDSRLTTSPWAHNDRPILLLQFQFGAAYTRVELFGVDPPDRPALLDGIEGALIDLLPGDDRPGLGAPVLRVYDTADLHGPPHCLTWSPASARLVAAAC